LVDRAREPSHPLLIMRRGSWTSRTLRWVSTWPAAQHMSRRSPIPLAGWCGRTIGSEAGQIDPEVVVTPGIFIDTVVTVPTPMPGPEEKAGGQ
jgi:hypothetical protein